MTRSPRFSFRQFFAAVGFALAATCVLQVVCYRPVNRGLDVETVVLLLGLPIFIAALCVRYIRPEEPLNPIARLVLNTSVVFVYVLTVFAFVPVAFLRDAWVFADVWAPQRGYDRVFAVLVGCTIGAAFFGCFCLTCLLDKWTFLAAAPELAKEVDDEATDGSGSGVYAGACRSGPAAVPSGALRHAHRHPCE